MKYTITANFNGKTFNTETDDVSKAIDELKPEQLLTEMYITVRGNELVSDRRLNLIQGRKLFANPEYKEIFINNLLLDYDRV